MVAGGEVHEDMKTSIIRIGNSQGIRIPKTFLEQCRLKGEVDLEVRGTNLVVRPMVSPRAGWDEAFRLMAERGDDRLLDADTPSQTIWDEAEWRW